jgi:hypothetical protein
LEAAVEKKIIFTIGKDGQMTVAAEGFTGSACLEKSEEIMRGLGIVAKQQKKPEFYEDAGVAIMQGVL